MLCDAREFVVSYMRIDSAKQLVMCHVAAKNANAWTRRISKVPTAKGVVVRRTTKAMATVTTITSEGFDYVRMSCGLCRT